MAEFALKCLYPVVSFLIPSFYLSLCSPRIKEALSCLDLYIVVLHLFFIPVLLLGKNPDKNYSNVELVRFVSSNSS